MEDTKKNTLIRVDDLTYGYEDDPVIKNLSLEVNAGEIVLIEGENGAGKTTLLKCMTGILNNCKSVFMDGKEISECKEELKNISFVMSEDFLYDYLTLRENVEFFKKLFDEDADFDKNIAFFVDKFGLGKYEDYLVKNLSQGTRNKLYIAIMFSKHHKILVLDEPFTALDTATQDVILDYVRGYTKLTDKAVIMVTHIAQFKEISTKRFLMKLRGEI